MNWKITFQTVETEIRSLVANSPENVYHQPDSCPSYTRGHCTNGSFGCIFGQAFKNLGVEIPPVLDFSDIETALIALEIPTSFEEIVWAARMQNAQDRKETWKNSLSLADCPWKDDEVR